MMEIFTWSLVVSAVAASCGWDAAPAISLENGYDLTSRAARKEAWGVIHEEAPDLIVLAFPCDPWSIMQNLNLGKEGFAVWLSTQKEAHRPLLRFVRRVVLHQRRRGKRFLIENPRTSRAWDGRLREIKSPLLT